jgi:hypothetical protein
MCLLNKGELSFSYGLTYVHPIHHLPTEILQKVFPCVSEPRLPDDEPFLQVYPE